MSYSARSSHRPSGTGEPGPVIPPPSEGFRTSLLENCTWSTRSPTRYPKPGQQHLPHRVYLLAPHLPVMCAHHDFLAEVEAFVKVLYDSSRPPPPGVSDADWDIYAEPHRSNERGTFKICGPPLTDWQIRQMEKSVKNRTTDTRYDEGRRRVQLYGDLRPPASPSVSGYANLRPHPPAPLGTPLYTPTTQGSFHHSSDSFSLYSASEVVTPGSSLRTPVNPSIRKSTSSRSIHSGPSDTPVYSSGRSYHIYSPNPTPGPKPMLTSPARKGPPPPLNLNSPHRSSGRPQGR